MKKLIAGIIMFGISLFGLANYANANECDDLYDEWEACCIQLYPYNQTLFYACLLAAGQAWDDCDLLGEITPPPC